MVNSSQKHSSRRGVVGQPAAAHQLHGIEKRTTKNKPKAKHGRRKRLPPPREITLRPVVAPTGLTGNVQKLQVEVARLQKLPVGSRYRKQRLQVVRHALKLATTTETISASDELVLDQLLSSLSLWRE
jgi:hypothetical protein